ncbi:hypothetical protein [Rhizobium leguminosarum]|uniref:hypothetical protein n=1 Tax=Rhizobium leguminosarum TaxID=384 RepID=UPI00143F705C|nr:hypothetical protein [Rhizobium leguminosarum]NKL21816.1 hypothetical protein [Rhizobium leguminosarum bv. viciae]
MLPILLVICAAISTFFIARFFAARTRLSEKAIEQMISEKLAESPLTVQLAHLREENGVMRNLLIDMVENEASLATAAEMTEFQRSQAVISRTVRRRELFGEALLVLRKTAPSDSGHQSLKIHG